MAIPKVAVVSLAADATGAVAGETSRALALELAARGAAVVVGGRDERALAETVGEVAFGGGRARHVVGDLAAARARATEVFGTPEATAEVSAEGSVALTRASEPAPLMVLASPTPEETARAVIESFANPRA